MARSKGDIKTKIESTFCPVHRERPVITIVNENDINIYGCCVEFEDIAERKYKKF